MHRLLVPVLLAACGGGTIEEPTETDTDPATDSDTDSDTDDTDTGDSAHTGVPPEDLELEVRFDGEVEAGWRLALWLSHVGDTGVTLGGEYLSESVSSFPFTLSVPVPWGDEVGSVGDLEGALLWFLVYEDADGDGAFADGEELVAGSARTLLFVTETDTGGTNEFWGMDFDGTGGYSFADVGEGIDLTSLRGAESLTLEGTVEYSGTPAGEPDRYATWTMEELGGATLTATRPLDEALADAFSVTVGGEPETARQSDLGGWMGALEVPLAYLDRDRSGGVSTGDQPALPTCSGGLPVILMWVAPITSVDPGAYAAIYGFQSGWSGWRYDSATDSSEALDAADLATLTLSDADCSFD